MLLHVAARAVIRNVLPYPAFSKNDMWTASGYPAWGICGGVRDNTMLGPLPDVLPTLPTRECVMAADPMRALIERYIACYNGFDVPGMLAVLHSDVEFRNLAAGQVTASASGMDEFRILAESSKVLFTSRDQQVTAWRNEGEAVVVEIRYEGVLASDLPNGMRAGDVLRLEGRSEFGFRDGRIDRVTDYS